LVLSHVFMDTSGVWGRKFRRSYAHDA